MAGHHQGERYPRGICSHCHGEYALRSGGTVRAHGPHPYSDGQWDCPGSLLPPVETPA